jgi:hypothetical protein
MAKMFLQSVKKPENKFEILSFDKETGIARLKGQYAEFDEPLNKTRMDKYGYTIIKEEANGH